MQIPQILNALSLKEQARAFIYNKLHKFIVTNVANNNMLMIMSTKFIFELHHLLNWIENINNKHFQEKLYDSYGVIDLLYIELLWDPG